MGTHILLILAPFVVAASFVLGAFAASLRAADAQERLRAGLTLLAQGKLETQVAGASEPERAFNQASAALKYLFGEVSARVEVLSETVEVLERTQAQDNFEGRLSSVGQLAVGAAHEINNPLAFMLANVNYAYDELVRMRGSLETDPAKLGDLVHALHEAREGAERVRGVVRDLSSFSRMDELGHGPVDVRQALRGAVKLAWKDIRGRATLIEDYESVLPIAGNESRLRQAFLNLITNAAQAIPAGNPEAHQIVLGVRSLGDHVIVEIRDTGEGIADEVRGRIFDPFFTTRPLGMGKGLGLSVTLGIITSQRGTIEVESRAGAGSTFRIALPALMGASPEARQARAAAAEKRARARVLVVDDEPNIGTSVRRTLLHVGDVVYSASAEEALQLISMGERFDVILCDLMMPGMNGMDLHEAAARLKPGVETDMVFMTGGAYTKEARAFLEAVPNTALEKPFDPAALREMVQDLASRRVVS